MAEICGECWILDDLPFFCTKNHQNDQIHEKNLENDKKNEQICLLLELDVDNRIHGAAWGRSQTEKNK